MEHEKVITAIKTGSIQHLYLLFGEEQYLMNQFIHTLEDCLLGEEEREMNLQIFDSDLDSRSLEAIVGTVPFMGERQIVLIKNSLLFSSGRNSSSSEGKQKKDNGLEELFNNLPEYTYLIFIAQEKIDRRKRLVKVIEKCGQVIEFTALKLRDIRPWLDTRLQQAGKTMQTNAKEYFISVVSLMSKISLGILEQEVNKLFLYTLNKESISKRDVEEILAAVPEVSVFAAIEKVTEKNVEEALRLLRHELSTGEHPLVMLALLNRQVRMLWQAKEWAKLGYSVSKIAENWKVPTFIAEKIMKQSRAFSIEQLKQATLLLAKTDCDFKQGRVSPDVLENIIILLCK